MIIIGESSVLWFTIFCCTLSPCSTFWRFTLVDVEGNRDQSSGLLLLDNGIVLGTLAIESTDSPVYFNDASATFLCTDMGYDGAISWNITANSPSSWVKVQRDYPIVLTRFDCDTYSYPYNYEDGIRNCAYGLGNLSLNHTTDVILECQRPACPADTFPFRTFKEKNWVTNCTACPPGATSAVNSVRCTCPISYFWNSKLHDCVQCPGPSFQTRTDGTSCECDGADNTYWDPDSHQCLSWTYTLTNDGVTFGVSSGILLADSGRRRGTVCANCFEDGNAFGDLEARLVCEAMGFPGLISWTTHYKEEHFPGQEHINFPGQMYTDSFIKYISCNSSSSTATDISNCTIVDSTSVSTNFYSRFEFYPPPLQFVFLKCATRSCPSNHYRQQGGGGDISSSSCRRCPGNTTSSADSTFCNCARDHFWSKLRLECVECPWNISCTSPHGSLSCRCPDGYVWDGATERAVEITVSKPNYSGPFHPIVTIGNATGTICIPHDNNDQAIDIGRMFCRLAGFPAEGYLPYHYDEGTLPDTGMYPSVMSFLGCIPGARSLSGDCTYLTGSSYLYGCQEDVAMVITCDASCDENQYYDVNRRYCLPCPTGTLSSRENSRFCDCREGYFWRAEDGECRLCPFGTTSNFGSTSCECTAEGFYWDSVTEYCMKFTFMDDPDSALLVSTDGSGQVWRPVCDTHFTNESARVVCNEMGFRSFTKFWSGAGPSKLVQNSNFTIDEFSCDTEAQSYTNCSYVLREYECDPKTYVYLKCFECPMDTYFNKAINSCVQCPRSLTTQREDATFCQCPPNEFWHDEEGDCMKCPTGSTSKGGERSCVCSGGLNWSDDLKECETWNFYLIDEGGRRGVENGLLIADNGHGVVGIVGQCTSHNYTATSVSCRDAGFLRGGSELPSSEWYWSIQYNYPVVISDMSCNESASFAYTQCTFHTNTPASCSNSAIRAVFLWCQSCPADTFYYDQRTIGGDADDPCVHCPQSTTSPPNSLGCTCPPGHYFDTTPVRCTPCPINHYSEGSGSNDTIHLSCTKCPELQVALNPGSDSCETCSIGHRWSNYTCEQCEDSQFGDGERCLPCPVGFEVGSGKCVHDAKDMKRIADEIKKKNIAIYSLSGLLGLVCVLLAILVVKGVLFCWNPRSGNELLINEMEFDDVEDNDQT